MNAQMMVISRKRGKIKVEGKKKNFKAQDALL